MTPKKIFPKKIIQNIFGRAFHADQFEILFRGSKINSAGENPKIQSSILIMLLDTRNLTGKY